MNDERKHLRQIGWCFLGAAVAVFVLSFAACALIQSGLLGRVPDIYGFIAYFGGPLPIIPAVFGTVGMASLGVSSRMK